MFDVRHSTPPKRCTCNIVKPVVAQTEFALRFQTSVVLSVSTRESMRSDMFKIYHLLETTNCMAQSSALKKAVLRFWLQTSYLGRWPVTMFTVTLSHHPVPANYVYVAKIDPCFQSVQSSFRCPTDSTRACCIRLTDKAAKSLL